VAIVINIFALLQWGTDHTEPRPEGKEYVIANSYKPGAPADRTSGGLLSAPSPAGDEPGSVDGQLQQQMEEAGAVDQADLLADKVELAQQAKEIQQQLSSTRIDPILSAKLLPRGAPQLPAELPEPDNSESASSRLGAASSAAGPNSTGSSTSKRKRSIPVRLSGVRSGADKYNAEKLDAVAGQVYMHRASLLGANPCPQVPVVLSLKALVQGVYLKNRPDIGLVNGSLIRIVQVHGSDPAGTPTTTTSSSSSSDALPDFASLTLEYTSKDGTVHQVRVGPEMFDNSSPGHVSRMTQFAVNLAYALTGLKAQGLTLPMVDIAASIRFCLRNYGWLYTALTRGIDRAGTRITLLDRHGRRLESQQEFTDELARLICAPYEPALRFELMVANYLRQDEDATLMRRALGLPTTGSIGHVEDVTRTCLQQVFDFGQEEIFSTLATYT
jgi:hypothetical protein